MVGPGKGPRKKEGSYSDWLAYLLVWAGGPGSFFSRLLLGGAILGLLMLLLKGCCGRGDKEEVRPSAEDVVETGGMGPSSETETGSNGRYGSLRTGRTVDRNTVVMAESRFFGNFVSSESNSLNVPIRPPVSNRAPLV
jgi:hypothetical protein